MIVFQNMIWLVVLIGVMILIHEAGHYWAARFFDVRIDVFSFGFGPRLFGFRRGETDFRVSAIPFGGYVKMAGDQPTDENLDDPRAFLAKARWQRLIVAFAGPAMNVVLAVAILTGMYMVKYPKPPSAASEGVIGYVEPNSAAAKAGLHEGDRIVQIDGVKNPTWDQITVKEVSSARQALPLWYDRQDRVYHTTLTPEMDERTGLGAAGWQEQGEVQVAGLWGKPAEQVGLKEGDILLRADGQRLRSQYRLNEIIRALNGKPFVLDYLRDGNEHSVTIQPAFMKLADGSERYAIGVTLRPRVVMVQLPFVAALRESATQNLRNATLIYQFLRGIVERRMSAKSLEGPIGIARLSGEAAREGPFAYLGLMAVVSLNLAVFNLLPIPILDGGVIVMLLVEMVMRRDLSLRVKEAVLKLGLVFLMAVMVFVLYNDISKILPAG